MKFYKKFDNGLRLVIEKMEGLYSVSAGVMVKTGSANESAEENGISHFIEHVTFKGTPNRSAYEISDYIDRIGAQINAYTAKEMTCYYTKSTYEHYEECLEVLSDIFFNSLFSEEEMEKEKGVILEEINMSEDTPDDLLFDLLAQSYFGNCGLGQTILGPAKNVKKFTRKEVKKYLEKYYTADNVIISIAGNVNVEKTAELVEKLFASKFVNKKSKPQVVSKIIEPKHIYKYKPIEQSHVGICMPAFSVDDERGEYLTVAGIVLGGGMSSRLFQSIREQSGLAYSVYAYNSTYKDHGITEIYAGVNPENRDLALEKIIEEIKKIKKEGITEQEFSRAIEQVKSSLILGRESTYTQMILSAKYLFYLDKQFDYEERLQKIKNMTLSDVNEAIRLSYDLTKASTATVGPKKSALKI